MLMVGCMRMTGALRLNLSRNLDYRGRPRQVFVKEGAVAADHGRCSDIGMTTLELLKPHGCRFLAKDSAALPGGRQGVYRVPDQDVLPSLQAPVCCRAEGTLLTVRWPRRCARG